MRAALLFLLGPAVIVGCARTDQQTVPADSVTSAARSSDCLGPGSPEISVGQVGQLRLDLTVGELKRICPTAHDSFARGDESLDTAIVVSRRGLSVVARVATLANEEGYRPYKADSSIRIRFWTISGTEAVLPKGVPLSAPWDSLVAAFGAPRVDPLNGDVYVWFCATLPGFVFHFDDRLYLTKPELAGRDSYPSSLKGAHIRELDVPSTPLRQAGCAG